MIVSDGRYWVSQCCKCHMVRRPDGWYRLDGVIAEIIEEAKQAHAETTYTHTFCPECSRVEHSRVKVINLDVAATDSGFSERMRGEIRRIMIEERKKRDTQLTSA